MCVAARRLACLAPSLASRASRGVARQALPSITRTRLAPDDRSAISNQLRHFSNGIAHETVTDRETITRLLYSLASRKEVERYLRIFSAANKFAVLKVGGAILTHQLDELALSLSFLHRV